MNFNEAYIENKDISLDIILAELDKNHENKKGIADVRLHLPRYLIWAERFDDVKKLFRHTKYGEEAKREFEMHKWLRNAEKKEKIEEAKMVKDFPVTKSLHLICHNVWWICRLHFPYKSIHVKNSNMMISGDGFGMAYFYFSSKEDIKVIEIGNPKMKAVFEKHQIHVDQTVSIDVLEKAMEEFVKKINSKINSLRLSSGLKNHL